MELILVRHGLPVRQELASGRADPELSGTGRQQAQHVADWLHNEGIDAIYTSPMRRARETADPLAIRLNCTPTVHDAIAEYDRAASHYIPMEELKQEDYPAWKEFVDGGYGDDYDMATFAKTVVTGMEEIITSHPGHRVAAFCHGGVINAWASHVLDMRPSLFIDVAYGSISRFLCASTGERNIRSLNETGHLGD
ncbi:MAG: histidine phosphatase family protein [Gammaproteobacteria bacterium]|nr:histidine phosphatase family protein [Gammaproteobacteria bacterium]